MGSHAGNSSSVKGAREQSVLRQGSGRTNKTSTAATDFLPLSCHGGIYCRAAEKKLLPFSTPWSVLIQIKHNACFCSDKYLDQKVPTRENRGRWIYLLSKYIPLRYYQKKGSSFMKESMMLWSALTLKEVAFLYLQLANVHESRSIMMCKSKTLPLLILQALSTDAEEALLFITWSPTQRKHTQAPTRETEVSHLPGQSSQPVWKKIWLSSPEIKENLQPNSSEVKHFGGRLLEAQLFWTF